MDWMAWDDTLETGHARMDADHRKLAELFDLLRDAVEHGGADKASCAALIDEIIGHAKTHFEREQRLMAQHRYPKAEQHAAEHAMLIRQALDYRESFDVDSAAAKSTLLRFADVWLAFHILFSDKELAAFFSTRNGAASLGADHFLSRPRSPDVCDRCLLPVPCPEQMWKASHTSAKCSQRRFCAAGSAWEASCGSPAPGGSASHARPRVVPPSGSDAAP